MANTIVEIPLPSGLSGCLLKLFDRGGDTLLNTGGDTLTERTNAKGLYTATVTEALAGVYRAIAYLSDGVTPIAFGRVHLQDDTATYYVLDEDGGGLTGGVYLIGGTGVAVASIAADAITNNAVASSAVAKIQSGLMTSGAYVLPDNDGITAIGAAVTAIGNSLTTLLSRVGNFAGGGLNTVLGFLRAIMRKDAALTPSDVGGTFDNTTDSLEAASESLSGVSQLLGSVEGARSVQISFVDQNGSPVSNVRYRIAGQGSAIADGEGESTIGLNDGTYSLIASPASGVVFPVTTRVVNSDETFEIEGLSPVIDEPDDPAECTVHIKAHSLDARLNYQLLKKSGRGFLLDGSPQISDAPDEETLVIQVVLKQETTYRFWGTDPNKYKDVFIPAQSTYELPNLI